MKSFDLVQESGFACGIEPEKQYRVFWQRCGVQIDRFDQMVHYEDWTPAHTFVSLEHEWRQIYGLSKEVRSKLSIRWHAVYQERYDVSFES